MWCLWRWSQGGGWGFALGTGLLLGFAVTIRYTEALLVLPVAWLAIWRMRTWGVGPTVKNLVIMGLGAAVAMTPLLVYQQVAFGSPWTTGYSLTAESRSFSWTWFQEHAWYTLVSMNQFSFGLPLLFPVAVVGLIGYAAWAIRRKSLAGLAMVGMLVLWVVPVALLYTAYYWITRGNPTLFLRFFVGLFPGVIIGALAVLELIARRGVMARLMVVLAVIVPPILVGVWVPGTTRDEQALLAMEMLNWSAASLTKEHVPAGSLVIADDWTCYFLVYAGDYRVIYPRYFDAKWVAARLKTMSGPGPWDFNQLRGKRFGEALGGRSQEELDKLLQEKVLGEVRAGKEVVLLTMEKDLATGAPRLPGWEQRLGASLRELGRDRYGFVVCRVEVRGAAASGK